MQLLTKATAEAKGLINVRTARLRGRKERRTYIFKDFGGDYIKTLRNQFL